MNIRITSIPVIFLLFILASCNQNEEKHIEFENDRLEQIENHTNKVVLSSEVKWEKLNPVRGDDSPQAGTIRGNRNGTKPTGFLAKFADGFSSPPHIHNVTYRAVVIKGSIHNDDPNASTMWMKPGSFWTQPIGESHITSAKGNENIALVEIDHGPYLVQPIEEAYDNGERPVNIDASNIVWLGSDKSTWIDSKSDVQLSFLWENKQSRSIFIKFPASYTGKLESNGSALHAVIIQGELNYDMPKQKQKILDAGSYFSSIDTAIHTISNVTQQDVLVYIRTNGNIKIY
ncbi:DUF4437 domain-containing protein [Gillisia sp. M10.2A]|uniref:DUF4437 domain-containing protein n=1 Tax=Gillisia lutea TaxID=2909668 RepID=A0ABS9EH48_9FLAO|nr:DUF4437 domain-containing protein [Gillisia lutea]MCF4102200.1 DUF4437 domain-containing protein [Gillisia lutea]